jgi:excinuclease UvrABC nuclease subunit
MNIEWKHQVIPSCKDGPDFSSLPETGGNYAIFYFEMASLHYRCIYVGKAENLKKGLSSTGQIQKRILK